MARGRILILQMLDQGFAGISWNKDRNRRTNAQVCVGVSPGYLKKKGCFLKVAIPLLLDDIWAYII